MSDNNQEEDIPKENPKTENESQDIYLNEAEETEEASPKTKKNKGTKKKAPIQPIVIKKINKKGGHHGGSWKIAYADFVTAMMAFFLLMWLISSLNKYQKQGLADYFKQPLKVALLGGKAIGDKDLTIPGGGADVTQKDGQVSANNKPEIPDKKISDNDRQKDEEMKQLKNLEAQLKENIEKNPSLSSLKDQLLMDITKEGLRIQLIDNQKNPMFDLGSDQLSPAAKGILTNLAQLLKSMPNKISIQGHTDANPYDKPEELKVSNWELSTQRANSARRVMVDAGLDESKVLRVTGFASTVLLDKNNPLNPINRRITIIVMKKEAADNLLSGE